MCSPYLIAAIGTPLDEDDTLHEGGLEAHLHEQWQGGMDGVLVAGSMGHMHLLRDRTYEQLVRKSCAFTRGKGEVLVGVGDTSLGRTLDRLAFVQELGVDGAVVLAPSFKLFPERALLGYFRAVADAASVPIYLYDLPPVVRQSLSVELVRQLAEHPNIQGIKCSGSPDLARLLRDEVPSEFRIIMAQPLHLDTFVRDGVGEHLDGVFALAPMWARQTADAAAAGDAERARACQRKLHRLLSVIRGNAGAAFTVLLNVRGIEGRFTPRPMPPFTDEELIQLREHPVIQELSTQQKGCTHA